MSATIEGDRVVLSSGERLTLNDLASLAEELPWITASGFIMPPHQYVVRDKLQSEREPETFDALHLTSRAHPASWRAFFRAYRSRNSYVVVGEHRYWYSQIGAAVMMNRCAADSEVENTRGAHGDRAIKSWTGAPYAWRLEYGLRCENLPSYCNVIAVELTDDDSASIVRYAAMVPRVAVLEWEKRRGEMPAVPTSITRAIKEAFDGVSSIAGLHEIHATKCDCSQEEGLLDAVWMRHGDMAPERVASNLRLFSTASRLQVEKVIPLSDSKVCLVELTVRAPST